jgi:Zn-dependent M16 (insulinase) family peptidase
VFETLKKQVSQGLDERVLEGAIRQTEFRLREIADSGRFPFNLLLAERCYRSWLYGGDPLAHLAFEKPLSAILELKKKGCGWFAEKIREFLIDNQHYLRITVRASSLMGRMLETQSQEQAAALSAGFTEADKKRILDQTERLVAEQKKQSSPEALASLPRLKKTDLPPRNQMVPVERARIAGAEAFLHPIFTAHIVYCNIGFDCCALPQDLFPYLPLYLELQTRCGAAGLSYEDMAKRISLSTGGIGSSIVCETGTGARNGLVFSCFLHAKALVGRYDEMTDILADLFHAPDLGNTKQIKDILFEMRNALNASVIDNGHHLAVINASSRLVASRNVDERLTGISQLRFLDKLVRDNSPEDISAKMKTLHQTIISRTSCIVSITADDPAKAATGLEQLIASLPAAPAAVAKFDFSGHGENTGIQISSSVNFAAKAWNLGAPSPNEVGRYLLLSRNLSTGYLWDKVRVEGGAYGGMAMASSGHPVFACASYRDPNLTSTLAHFEKGLAEVGRGLDPASVDQSIIGAIGRVDAPRTPHEKGFGETVALLCGRTPDFRQAVRDSVLSTTPASLAETAKSLLDNKRSSVTVLGASSAFDAAEKEGCSFKREALLEEESGEAQ